ncbi:MAG: hypothetical protein Q9217_000599 [Psora testacea]
MVAMTFPFMRAGSEIAMDLRAGMIAGFGGGLSEGRLQAEGKEVAVVLVWLDSVSDLESTNGHLNLSFINLNYGVLEDNTPIHIRMNTILQSQLDRVESALTTLIDSIASYNPSVPAAQTLLSADSSLQAGLKQLQTHQQNHARILQLRERIDRQNAQVTSTLQLLADTRSNLLAIPTSLPPKGRRDVRCGELLDYAKRIARFTMPPNFRPAMPPTTDNAIAANGTDTAMADTRAGGEGIGLESLQQEEKRWLDPWTGVQFTPWPSEEVMRRSALAQLQVMVERGEDVEKMEEDVKDEKQEDGLGPGDGLGSEKADGRIRGMTGLQRREEKPRVFGGLDLYDPDQEG